MPLSPGEVERIRRKSIDEDLQSVIKRVDEGLVATPAGRSFRLSISGISAAVQKEVGSIYLNAGWEVDWGEDLSHGYYMEFSPRS